MSREILVNITPREARAALVENGVLQELYVERANRRGLVGNLYRGRVTRVLPGMQAAFVDIGLDSITGVTWVRKINAKYQTRIEATKVYSHPTLRQFCEFVQERVSAQAPTQSAERPRAQVALQTVPAAPPPVGSPPFASFMVFYSQAIFLR